MKRIRPVVAAMLAFASLHARADETPQPPAWRLLSSSSPYLRQQADQPIAWQPWTPQALEAARNENKLIFVSVGYSTCHWCHVMAREAFSDAATAAVLNANVICIKVDRDERPDLDRRFIEFLEALNGTAGWPANIWLTPDGKPFFGTSYVPLHDEAGSPGFATLVDRMCGLWRDNPDAIRGQATEVAAALKAPAGGPASVTTDALNATWLESVSTSYDKALGGFECGPKFPNPTLLRALLQPQADEKAAEMALHTLRQMARGGIHDILGGGFHRYAVDAQWHCPHFEKMLNDQGLLLAAYADAFSLTGDQEFQATAESIVRGLAAFRLPSGGLASALDAERTARDGKRAEGAHYLWQADELTCITNPDTRSTLSTLFGFTEDGNVSGTSALIPAGSNVIDPPDDQPWQTLLAGATGDAVATLTRERAKRPSPWRDETELTTSTALVVSGLVRAGTVCERKDWLETAEALGDRLRRLHFNDASGRLNRTAASAPLPAFAEDYAYTIAAALDLHRATGRVEWLEWALRLQAIEDAAFLDANRHLYATESATPQTEDRRFDLVDRAEPSANAVSLVNLLRLAGLTGNEDFRDRANSLWRAAAPSVAALPAAHPSLVVTSRWIEHAPLTILVTGAENSSEATKMWWQANREATWASAVLRIHPANTEQLGKSAPDILSLLPDGAAETASYVCENRSCSAPITSAAALAKRLSPKPRTP